MRIGQSETLRVSAGLSAIALFKNVKVGTEMKARVIERPGGNAAVLDIAGKKIRAEFLKGVPGNNILILRLEEKLDNTFVFKIASPTGRDGFLNQIQEFILFDTGGLDRSAFSALSRYISGGLHGLFELNYFLLSGGRKPGKDSFSVLLNRLLEMGFNKDTLMSLVMMSRLSRQEFSFLLPVLLFMGYKKHDIESLLSKGGLDRSIDSFIEDVSGMDTASKSEVIEKVLEFLLDEGTLSRHIQYGEFPCFDDEIFRPVTYMGHKNTWIFFLDLSALGSIELLFHDFNQSLSLILYSKREDALEFLESRAHELHEELVKYYPDVTVEISNLRSVLDKIVEINSYYSMNSAVDVKV